MVRSIAGLGQTTRSWAGLNYWSAKDWCEAQGLRLMTATELQCHKISSTAFIDTANQETGLCRKENTSGTSGSFFSPPVRDMLGSGSTGFAGYGSDQYSMWTSTTFDSCNNYVLNKGASIVSSELTTRQYATCVVP